MRRRVFVTGIGCVTPHGDAPDAMFERLVAGEVAIGREPVPRSPDGDGALVARARWDPDRELTPKQRSGMDPVAQMGLVAGLHALRRAGLEPWDPALATAGLCVGCALGGITTQEDVYDRYFTHRLRTFRPTSIPRVMANATAAHLAMALGIKGPNHTYSIACSSSATAIGEAFRAIRDGYLELPLPMPRRFVVIDGLRSREEVHTQIRSELETRFQP